MKMNWRSTERLLYNTQSQVEKIEKWLGRGLCPWRGLKRETEINYAEAFMSGSSHYWGLPALGSDMEGKHPWLVGWTGWLCKAWLTCEGHSLLACLAGRGQLKPHGWLTGFLQPPGPMAQPELSRCSRLHLFHIPIPHGWGQKPRCETSWAGSHLRCSLSRGRDSHCWCWHQEAVWISDGDQTTTPCTPALTKYTNTLSQTQLNN